MDSNVAKSLDYQKVAKSHPYYRYNKILPLSGSQTQTLSSSGGTEVVFEIPVCAFNLAQSYLQFNLNVGTIGTAGNSPWIYSDVLGAIRQIQLYTRNAIYLADIYNANNMTKVMCKPNISLKDFLTYDVGAGGAANTNGTGTFSTLSRNTSTIGTVASVNTRVPPGGNNSTNTENIYVRPGITPLTTATSYGYRIPLKQLTNTIFSLDKVIYANEILVMRTVFDSFDKIGFIGTSLTNPAAGAAVIPTATVITVSSLTTYLAVEQDPLIIQGLRQQVASGGFSVLIPYIYCYKNALTGTSQTVSLRFNRGHGRRLQRIYTSTFVTAETVTAGSPDAYNCNNRSGAKVTIKESKKLILM